MEELGIPAHLRAVVHRLYEEVKVKIRTHDGISTSFRSDIGVKQGCPLSPTLFGLCIDKLEEWLNMQNGDGIQLGEFVIRLLLYADDLILLANSALGLQEHLFALEHFCNIVGMQVNISKTKIMVFSSRRKQEQHKFYFEGSILEEVADYKYLGIDFNQSLSWEGCRKKRTLGGWKALYALQNRCAEAELWDWKTIQTLFRLLVLSVILYGCEVWASNTLDSQWKQIERIQKRLITSKFKIKSTVPYDIMLSETGAAPIEAAAMLRTNSHQLRCETEWWKRPKEIWEERVCPFCVSGSVETEKHFILECEALKVSREKFVNFLTASTWYNLFNEEHIVKMGALIISLNKQRSDLKKTDSA
ncbi:uncharacterized protein LOC131876576 [Cryptomeria japonica]|uniref:uncharacterized protein LOC131876576 n=1 Tax=Cryptomeria japonica TaxID=3369 RepID=UPI0027D9F665|nr:uncharacterized protein LOC131876576 [Cryptomeria japonica]